MDEWLKLDVKQRMSGILNAYRHFFSGKHPICCVWSNEYPGNDKWKWMVNGKARNKEIV
jgi:hypothetical protein